MRTQSQRLNRMQQSMFEENKKIANMTQTEDTIRLQTERDTYKTMYEQLLNRLVNGGAA